MKKLKFLLIGAVAAFALSSGVGVVSAGGPLVLLAVEHHQKLPRI